MVATEVRVWVRNIYCTGKQQKNSITLKIMGPSKKEGLDSVFRRVLGSPVPTSIEMDLRDS